jgi:hypothetical protein
VKPEDLPDMDGLAGSPCRAWVGATAIHLDALRRTLIAQHREAFETLALDSFDPSNWIARCLADQIIALLKALDLYQHARRCAEDIAQDF